MPRPTRAQRIDRYKILVQGNVVSCPNCQPWEGGPVWVVGQRTDLSELLDTLGVPEGETFRGEVLEGIECPGCRDAISSWYEVGVRFPFEVDHERAIERAETRYGTKLRDFAEFLERLPMLGASHPLGRRILKEIGGFPKARLEPASWFRARRIKSGKRFTSDDLRIPDPSDVLSPGRFNHLGQAHWYLADNEYTAVAEVVGDGEEMAWLQKWQVGPIEPVLDLIVFGADDPVSRTDVPAKELPLLAAAMIFGGHLNRPVDRKKGWKPEYFLPHYVADAAKGAGFKGIRASSSRGAGVNLIAFDPGAPILADADPVILDLTTYFSSSPF